MSGACFPDLRPRRCIFLASTAAPLDSNSSAAATWPLTAAKCSGVSPQALFPRNPSGRCGLLAVDGAEADAPWEDDGSCGNAELYTRSTEKRMMNVLESTSSKLFTFTNTLDKFQYIFFTTLLLMKTYVILIAFSMMMRPVRTMSSISSIR